MSGYRKVWDCCGDETYTEAWEPEVCPFCVDVNPEPFGTDSLYQAAKSADYGSNVSVSAQLVVELIEAMRSK